MQWPTLFKCHACRLPRWAGIVCSGLAAGTLATLAQVMLLLALGDDVPAILSRDARLTAALALGSSVLPPGGFDAWIWFVAAVIHFALSVAYAALLWPLARLPRATVLISGAVFGIALYGINLYGFTEIYPWFAQARGPSAAFAHVAFGVTAAAVSRFLALRSAGPSPAGH
jgi:hypothetical protein